MPDHDACVVAIEIDQRQRYLFETDKLREMLGASRLMVDSARVAKDCFQDSAGTFLFQPVSGVLYAWATKDKRSALLDAAWKVRAWLDDRGIAHTSAYLKADSRRLQSTGEAQEADLADLIRKVSRAVNVRKGLKSGEDARPRCSLFAMCQIHGLDPANVFRPDSRQAEGGEERRRELVGHRADEKFTTWQDDQKTRFYHDHLAIPVRKKLDLEADRPITFADLRNERRAEEGDGYIAFICADGDGMGLLLESVDWNSSDWGTDDDREPWRRNREFAEEYDACVREAFEKAVVRLMEGWDRQNLRARTTEDRKETRVVLPLLPQVLGGDDLWMVTEREAALPMARYFMEAYRELAESKPTLARALDVARAKGNELALTISVGIAFAKSGYPAHAMADAAEDLLKSAKNLRKDQEWGRTGEASLEPCMDWHWIESSVSEKVTESRQRWWSYRDGGTTLRLTSRPWTAEQLSEFEEAARALASVPRRKREQLETLLRVGVEPGKLMWEAWWKGLGTTGRSAMQRVNDALPERWKLAEGVAIDHRTVPWRDLGSHQVPGAEPSREQTVRATVLIDLLALQHVLGLEGESDDTAD